MIVIIDYGLNNVRSLVGKLHRSGINAIATDDIKIIKSATKLILPGVGYFGTAMKNLKDSGIIDVLRKKVLLDKTPILGICLGFQLFANSSEEGKADGLGFIDGTVERFDSPFLKIPHVGWNKINIKKASALLKDIDTEKRFYFTHSYHYKCPSKYVVATTEYGHDFPSIIQKDNICGVQFHPEKSHISGFKLIENFINCFSV
jgi:glutamine amidotransferase